MTKSNLTSFLLTMLVVFSLRTGSTAYSAQITVQWEFNSEDVHLEEKGPYTYVSLKDGILHVEIAKSATCKNIAIRPPGIGE